ncbi:hypothetical protein [Stenotrophomonas maltophilia]|uniref:hypothetical protein n=1 Tax=Stenotrophomonas maltophilia TaxID=40324 RepID=UPI0015DBFCF3|nr:hypothetical protein [Stenotrophomonas maltophilia]QDL29616.1 hypothetical protein EGM71_18335 [Stenotrophomonas maltophilia]
MELVLSCPYCFRESQLGIRVCQGCRAEVHYGAPKEARQAAMLAAIISGLYLAVTFNVYVGAAAFAIVVFGLAKLIKEKYKDRVVFKRVFNTHH